MTQIISSQRRLKMPGIKMVRILLTIEFTLQFLFCVSERRDLFVISSISKLFDEFVRDVIVEDESVQVKRGLRHSGFSIGTPAIQRKVTLTSRQLIIQVLLQLKLGTFRDWRGSVSFLLGNLEFYWLIWVQNCTVVQT
jgi:hypothetical protein